MSQEWGDVPNEQQVIGITGVPASQTVAGEKPQNTTVVTYASNIFYQDVNKTNIYQYINALKFVSLYLHPWSPSYSTPPIKRDFSQKFQNPIISYNCMIL